MSAGRRVAITGLGAICALGQDVGAIWRGILDARCAIRPICGIATERLSVQVAGEVPDFDPARHFETRRLAMLDRTSQLALLAAREAMRDAGLGPDLALSRRRGAVLGAAIGQQTLDAAYDQFYGERCNRVHPLTVPRAMPSAPASQVSMEFGLRGPCLSVASACASSGHAIGLAMQLIRSGMSDMMVAGGSDASIVVGVVKSWEALRVLSAEPCRPFSRDRTGLSLGEGAGIMVLEAWDQAEARGARIHGEVAGFGMNADAMDLTAPDASGAAEAMEAAMADAGMTCRDVSYVNAHGTGTRLNDRTECDALHRVFGVAVPPASSSKSMFGHCLSAAGALEAVVTVLALRESVLPPTIGFRAADPECDIDCVANTPREARISAALSNSFAFGGLNAVLALRRAS